jgi:hypothetical protein
MDHTGDDSELGTTEMRQPEVINDIFGGLDMK